MLDAKVDSEEMHEKLLDSALVVMLEACRECVEVPCLISLKITSRVGSYICGLL